MDGSGAGFKKGYKIRVKQDQRLKGKRAQADGTSEAFTQSLAETDRNRKAGRHQRDAAAAVKEHIVHFLLGRVPIIEGFAYRPGNVPDEPEQNEHPNGSTLHAPQYSSARLAGASDYIPRSDSVCRSADLQVGILKAVPG